MGGLPIERGGLRIDGCGLQRSSEQSSGIKASCVIHAADERGIGGDLWIRGKVRCTWWTAVKR
jgi:hypothetical protein